MKTQPNCTETVFVTVQLAFIWKKLVEHECESWEDATLRTWQDNKLTAGEKRILFSQWVSAVWKELKTKTEFQKIGLILKKDGSEKHMLKIAGVEDSEVPSCFI